MPWYSLNSLIAGANDAHYMRFASRRILSLNDITPDPVEDGIFHQIQNYPWNQLPAQSQVLNLDYYYNVSGDKIASKYLQARAEKQTDEETGETYYTIPSSIMTNIGALITIKYQRKWVELWNQYAIQSWFDNIKIDRETSTDGDESISDDGSIEHSGRDETTGSNSVTGSYTDSTDIDDTRSLSKSGSIVESMSNHEDKMTLEHTGDDVVVLTNSGTIEDNITKRLSGTNTDTLTHNTTKSNTGYSTTEFRPSGDDITILSHAGFDSTNTVHSGTIGDVINSNSNDLSFGFNTVGDNGNPTLKNVTSNSTTRTFDNSDAVTVTPGVTDTTTVTLSVKTERIDNNLSEAMTGVDTTDHVLGERHDDVVTKTLSDTHRTVTTPGVKDTNIETLKYDKSNTFQGYMETKGGSFTSDVTRTFTNFIKPFEKDVKYGLKKDISNIRDITRSNHVMETVRGFDYRRENRIEELVKLFENPNLFPFFQIVYSDIDEVMCLPVFK